MPALETQDYHPFPENQLSADVEEADANPQIPEDLQLAEDNPQGHELSASLFVSHMATYPAVAAMVGFVASFPVVKVFASNAVPLAMAWRKRSQRNQALERVAPVIKGADKLGDNLLNRVDKRFPQLKTAQPDEVMEMATTPIKNARRAASIYGSAAHGFVSKRVANPARKAAHSARSRYTRIYDNNGKPILRSRLDPVISPFNDRAEELIIDYFPDNKDEVKKPVTNELSRSIKLGRVAAKKTRPAVRNRFYTITQLPGETRDHVVKVYTARNSKYQKDDEEGLNRRARVLATLGTIKQLSQEGTSLLRKRLNPQKSSSDKDDISRRMDRIPQDEREAVDELVGYLRNESTATAATTTTTPGSPYGQQSFLREFEVNDPDFYGTNTATTTNAPPTVLGTEEEYVV